MSENKHTSGPVIVNPSDLPPLPDADGEIQVHMGMFGVQTIDAYRPSTVIEFACRAAEFVIAQREKRTGSQP